MAKASGKAYSRGIFDLMEEKTALLSQAHSLAEMGMTAGARALWESAASYEERLAPLLEAAGREQEAAVHRISAASCYRRAGDASRAANLFRAALGGPLPDKARRDVEQMLAQCLAELKVASPAPSRRSRRQPQPGP